MNAASTGQRGAPAPDRVLTAPFVLVCAATLAFWVSVFAHLPLLPLYMADAGFGEDRIGLVYGSGALTALAGRVACGWAVDRWGARWFLVTGALLWAVTSPPAGAADSVAALLALWLVKGVALGVFTTASIAYVTQVAPPERRGTAVGWWGAANSVAAAAGPAAGALVQAEYGFLAGFTAAGAVGLLAATAGLAPRVKLAPTGPPKPIRLYSRVALVPGCFGALVAFATSAFSIFAPLRARELGMGNVGLYLSVYAIALIAARVTFGPLSDRMGRSVAIVPSLALMAVAMGLIGFVADPVLGLVVPALFGLGVGGAMPNLLAWTVDRVAPDERGVASSTFYSVYEVGLFLGASVLGQLLLAASFERFVVVAALLAGGCLAYVAVAAAERHGPVAAPAGGAASGQQA